MSKKSKLTFKEYPNAFKVLILANFIDLIGIFILFPFYSLYITERFGVGMLEVGFLYSLNSTGNIIGILLGGALADKLGRRRLLLFGLIFSGVNNILMGLLNDLTFFYILTLFFGLIGSIGAPARQAMVADLLPRKKQSDGYGMLRISHNLAATVGPILGGFLAIQSYMFLFVADAICSIITAILVYFIIPETKPEKINEEETVIKSFIGYKEVLKDWLFMCFLIVSTIMTIVYIQMNSTLSVYLRDIHGFPASGFGILFSINALMVVLFQFSITKKISRYNPMKMMTFGTLFYIIGFGMYGFVSEVYLFVIAIMIITIGEMIVSPIGTTTTAFFSPPDKRGRYMAIYHFHWVIPNLFGVILAGLVWDTLGPNWIWYLAVIVLLITMIGFWLLHSATKERFSEIKKDNKSNRED